MNTWELCPKCKGEKKVQANSNIKYYVNCNICDGQGIISSITGKPPKSKDNHWNKVDFSREVEDLIHK